MFTKKHYEFLALELGKAKAEKTTVALLACALERDNPAFKMDKFIKTVDLFR